MPKTITIVGGGLAGLTLGIGLRQRDIPVTIWEAGSYPRHRVCGEFISGAGQQSLARLGLAEGLQNAGANSASTAAFFAGASSVATIQLPQLAWCLSRLVLDNWLAREFQLNGGELRSSARWTHSYGAGIVRATGRRPASISEGWRWFGLKVHARDVPLEADLELHLVPSGYVGLCRLKDGVVNACGLFRHPTPVVDLAQRWRDWLSGPATSALHARLVHARFDDDSFCSVAGLCLRSQRAIQQDECCLGDRLTMIPPLTGNGMSMAFEAAELAIEPLAQYSQGERSWTEAQEEIAHRCDRQFAPRLRWAGWLQRVLFQPQIRRSLLFAARSSWIRRHLFERTR